MILPRCPRRVVPSTDFYMAARSQAQPRKLQVLNKNRTDSFRIYKLAIFTGKNRENITCSLEAVSIYNAFKTGIIDIF